MVLVVQSQVVPLGLQQVPEQEELRVRQLEVRLVMRLVMLFALKMMKETIVMR
ncbi:MAG: hypothetical protein IPM37_07720 [Hahellaceae bacterium]|nr:hypothetical protein [Hahellaceae bacterium]